MKRLHIIKAGSTFAATARERGDFEDWIIRALRLDPRRIRVVHAHEGEPLPPAGECGGVIVTGSHAMVTDRLPWSEALAAWIPPLVRASVPFLGICYGHQLLAHALGGRVDFHPGGREVGTVDIRLLPEGSSDVLFRALPSPFKAHVSHAQTVLALPRGAIRLAENPFEPTHAFKVGACAWGVQFHPEYDTGIMESYIQHRAVDLAASGQDVPGLLRTVTDTPAAAAILQRFAAVAAQAGSAEDKEES